MARKQAENQTFISLQDALQLVADVERHYGVKLELVGGSARMVRERWVQYFCLSAYSRSGASPGECLCSFGLEYPSIEAHTYPIALLTLCNRVSARLEARQARKKASETQLGLFD